MSHFVQRVSRGRQDSPHRFPRLADTERMSRGGALKKFIAGGYGGSWLLHRVVLTFLAAARMQWFRSIEGSISRTSMLRLPFWEQLADDGHELCIQHKREPRRSSSHVVLRGQTQRSSLG